MAEIHAKRVGGAHTSQSTTEQQLNARLLEILSGLLPVFGDQYWSNHILVGVRRQTLARQLYFLELYKQILDVPGVILEFGVEWGAGLVQLMNLRGMFEPYNHTRKLVGFDTFEGFVDLTNNDGTESSIGDYSTLQNYEEILEEILQIHENLSPLSHIKKFELVKGDASITTKGWLSENPHATVSMVIFDMDLYQPTKDVLESVIPRLTKGSLLVFDELNSPHFPGETSALNDVLGLNNIRLHRFPHQNYCSWAVWGES